MKGRLARIDANRTEPLGWSLGPNKFEQISVDHFAMRSRHAMWEARIEFSLSVLKQLG
jgi:hypothetical protein